MLCLLIIIWVMYENYSGESYIECDTAGMIGALGVDIWLLYFIDKIFF